MQKNDGQLPFAKSEPVVAIIINPEMSEEQIRNSVRIILDEWKKMRGEVV